MCFRFTALLLIAILGVLGATSSQAGGEATAAITPPVADPWNSAEVDALIREGVRHDSNGDFEAAAATWKRLADAAPDHPAAHVHAADTLIWLQIFEDDDTRYDEAIERECEAAIAKAEAWTKARPNDARAHLYLGHAVMTLGRLHGIRMRIYRAGTYAERSRKELERALELDPTLADAKYSLGIYFYYASLIPDLVQWLSFLWFVPTADAPLGLRYLEEVRQDGDLYQFTAEFYLSNIRTYHDKWLDLPFGLASIRRLHENHPRNSLIHFELVEALMLAGHYEEVAREARELESHTGTGDHDRGRASMGRVWRARAELHLGRAERGWQLLETFGEDGPAKPSWGNRWVNVTRAQIKDALGQRAQAIAYYKRVTALDLNPKFSRAMEMAEAGAAQPFRPPPQITAQNPKPGSPAPF